MDSAVELSPLPLSDQPAGIISGKGTIQIWPIPSHSSGLSAVLLPSYSHLETETPATPLTKTTGAGPFSDCGPFFTVGLIGSNGP